MALGRDRIEYKSPAQIALMRRAGLVVADALAAVREAARPGLTTADLDQVAERVIRGAGAIPSFVGYHGFPASLCISVNDEVVHGIPGARVLEAGDVVSVDCGAILEGWHGDSAVTMILGAAGPLDLAGLPADAPLDGELQGEAPDAGDVALVRDTESAMWAGIAALATAQRLGEVGDAIEDAATASGREYGILEEYVGHGIGSAMHQAPEVLNYRSKDRGPRMKPGMCLAIEPMFTRGTRQTRVLEDEWTVVTTDGSRAAHWEHSVAVMREGIVVLTAHDGGAAGLAPFGIVPVPV